MEQRCFILRHLDKDVCKKSSSGGAFTAITDSWFSAWGEKAVVYGCVLDDTMTAKHVRAEIPAERDIMRGSKYIGSNMSGVLRKVESDLRNGRYVAFSGTPCQIGGLTAFLQARGITSGEQLLTIEVVCHGVGSVRFFHDYIAFYEQKYRSAVTYCSFRGKSRPGKRQEMVLHFANGRKYISPAARYDGFLSAYGRNYLLRPSCFQCKYAIAVRNADITIADYWNDTMGNAEARSAVIASTSVGYFWLQNSFSVANIEEVTLRMIHQPQLSAPSEQPRDYGQFWRMYEESGYQAVQSWLGNNTLVGKIKLFLVRILYVVHMTDLIKYMKNLVRKMLWGK